jgi:type I restriction enzyme S subunit
MSIAQHAVNQSFINEAKMKATPFTLSPIGEQRRIVEKIE